MFAKCPAQCKWPTDTRFFGEREERLFPSWWYLYFSRNTCCFASWGTSRDHCFKVTYNPFTGAYSFPSSYIWRAGGVQKRKQHWLGALDWVILAWLPLEPTLLEGMFPHRRIYGHMEIRDLKPSLNSASCSTILVKSQAFINLWILIGEKQ